MATTNGRDLNRAERFDDEKRRIIDSCFNKKDDDGSILETYITHIRIVEYSSHPTSPPPPQARTPQTQKPRVIIVAVRKSGRVRVHKSKENANGTFSIGKTWNLDDLNALESFSGPNVPPNLREWAADVGFVITLGKPYYWQAQTDKEKKFFVASLVKIYTKYTSGRMPQLNNFAQYELDQILGGAQAPRRPDPPAPQMLAEAQAPRRPPPEAAPQGYPEAQAPRRPPPDNFIPRRPPPLEGGISATSTLTANSGYPGSLTPRAAPSFERPPSRSPMQTNGSASPAASIDSTRPSHEQAPSLRRIANNNRSQDSVTASLAARSDDGSLRPRSRNGPGGTSAYTSPEVPPQPPVEEPPPERKRPHMDPLRPQNADRDLVPAPLMSPGMRREPLVPPRSMDRMSPRKNSVNRRPEAFLDRPRTSDSRASETSSVPPVESRPLEIRSVESRLADVRPVEAKSDEVEEVSRTATPTAETPISINTAVSAAAPETPAESPIEPGLEEMRPGLVPMIKSKKSRGEIAGAFWKAASTASAFKPRPGGAADRLRKMNKSSEGPDGITEVVPAPPRPEPARNTPEPAPATPEPPAPVVEAALSVPEVKVSVPSSSRPTSLQASVKEAARIAEAESKQSPAAAEKRSEARKSIISGNDGKYLASLGLDPAILDDRSTEFGKWLDHFSWVPGDQMRAKSFDELRIDMDRELDKAQAGGWLTRFQEEDERVNLIKSGVDLAIAECEELDNLLTLYSVELSTLSDDIAYIEAQGQGLQVQAANQKLLMKELESLIETCAISESDLDALKVAPLESAVGIEEIEAALVTLYKAMRKIDPAMGSDDLRKSEDESGDQSAGLNSDYGKMRIVQEKKEMYVNESALFMRRLVEFMARQFDEACRATKGALDSALTKKVDARNHEAGRDLLWMYSPLILYARDADAANWGRIIQIYQDKSHPIYKTEFREAMDVWKKNAKKMTGDDSEYLFTALQEKKEEGIATTARKLTVKRSQTLARSLRSPLGDGSRTNLDKSADSRAYPHEVFAGVLDDLLPLVEMEQNFIVDFFHATTLGQMDFPDLVAMTRPRERRGNDLKRHRLMEPDRELARRVTRTMEVIFSFLEANIQLLVDWALGADPLQGVGVLASLERKTAETSQSNQDFLNALLQRLHGNLESKFKKFVDDEIRAIEETKVKIKKRKGLIGFMRVFPQFSLHVEEMLVGVDTNMPVRRLVDREYDRVLKTMFDSLKVIARENPAAGMASVGGSNSGDPEDKEALNFHILLIENMNYYVEEVQNERGIEVLNDWKDQAQSEMAEHMELYLNAVMRRPLGKLLETLENIEGQLNNGKSPSAIAAQPSNSKAVFNKTLGAYDGREVRKGIETLRKRVEKHFGDTDDPALNKPLVNRMLRECERFYNNVELRIGSVTTTVYGGDVLFEWPRAEVKSAFSMVGR